MDKKTLKSTEETPAAEDSKVLKEESLADVSGGSASASPKYYRCPKCGSFAYPTGTSVHIGSSSYYPTGFYKHYECGYCGELYLECELDGTVEPRI